MQSEYVQGSEQSAAEKQQSVFECFHKRFRIDLMRAVEFFAFAFTSASVGNSSN